MGLLVVGKPADWEGTKKHRQLVKKCGIEQFLSIYKANKDKKNAVLRWGDEVEYFVCLMNEEEGVAKLPLRAPEILEGLHEFRESLLATSANECVKCAKNIIWHPEYANWMLEATPGYPYKENIENLLDVEANMILRRKCIQKFLKPGEQLFTMTSFPRMGTPEFTVPWHPPTPYAADGASLSSYMPDEAINPHPRFPTLTANIRQRRGERVRIVVPAYPDRDTAAALQRHADAIAAADAAAAAAGAPFMPAGPAAAAAAAAGGIHMDCMAFGMGAGCLQMTFQAEDVCQARFLYDQLAIVAPLMLALTAATPILRGFLADTDVRWDVISGSVDDRTAVERGETPPAGGAAAGEVPIPKSRYSSVDCFISTSPLLRDELNDLPVVVSDEALARLTEAGVDARLARHVAHLFCRDPLVVFEDRLEQSLEEEADHFESIQSTNWNTVRFKPPPPGSSSINWRVEFRSMELCLTDFENAANVVFVLLISRAILHLGLNLYMPISLVDDNMARAHARNAPATTKFWVRRNVYRSADSEEPAACEVAEMSLGDVFCGDGSGFPGLCGLVRAYLDEVECDEAVRAHLERYLDLIGKRARGELLTTAEWMRRFVLAHPDYKCDSEVSPRICFDLLKVCGEVSRGERAAPELLGEACSQVKEDERVGAGVMATLTRSCQCD